MSCINVRRLYTVNQTDPKSLETRFLFAGFYTFEVQIKSRLFGSNSEYPIFSNDSLNLLKRLLGNISIYRSLSYTLRSLTVAI